MTRAGITGMDGEGYAAARFSRERERESELSFFCGSNCWYSTHKYTLNRFTITTGK